MLVQLECINNGENCWNAGVIQTYAEGVEKQEARHADNPRINVGAGRITCQGCMVNEVGHGTFCTAEMIKTRIIAAGKTAPELDMDYDLVTNIPGFSKVKPNSGKEPIKGLTSAE